MRIWDGCDEAFIGVGRRCGQPRVAVYDYRKLVAKFVADGMTHEDAVEWIDFNILGAWIGQDTPIILFRKKLKKKAG